MGIDRQLLPMPIAPSLERGLLGAQTAQEASGYMESPRVSLLASLPTHPEIQRVTDFSSIQHGLPKWARF